MTEPPDPHVCRESRDPRHAGFCACGKRLVRTARRDLAFERFVVEMSAQGITDPAPVLERMLWRSSRLSGEYVNDPMDIRLDTDQLKDGQEEGDDWLNRVVWWLYLNAEHPQRERGIELARHILAALEITRDLLNP